MTGKSGELPMEIGVGVPLAEPSDPVIPTPWRWITPPFPRWMLTLHCLPSCRPRLRQCQTT